MGPQAALLFRPVSETPQLRSAAGRLSRPWCRLLTILQGDFALRSGCSNVCNLHCCSAIASCMRFSIWRCSSGDAAPPPPPIRMSQRSRLACLHMQQRHSLVSHEQTVQQQSGTVTHQGQLLISRPSCLDVAMIFGTRQKSRSRRRETRSESERNYK